jgi:hypothetical protein
MEDLIVLQIGIELPNAVFKFKGEKCVSWKTKVSFNGSSICERDWNWPKKKGAGRGVVTGKLYNPRRFKNVQTLPTEY